MTVFVDTSSLFAALDRDEPRHAAVTRAFRNLADSRLVTHNYVLTESAALVERRLGKEHVRHLLTELVAPIEVLWVDEVVYSAATSAYLATDARGPSLVDFTSFELMRRQGIRTALAIDRDFADAGFDVTPG